MRSGKNRAVLCVAGMLVLATSWLALQSGWTGGLDRAGFRALALPTRGWVADGAQTAVDVAKVVLALAAVALLGLLAARRAWRECLAILGGLVLGQAAAHLAKSTVARPRPPHELVLAGGWSFPSTTSTLGTAFLFLAIAVAPARGCGRTVTIAAGGVVTILLGLSFVALRVHYLSDVLAGLAMGAIAFTGCETIVDAVARPGERAEAR
jgi:membrane-associated phospholipid phosphatase